MKLFYKLLLILFTSNYILGQENTNVDTNYLSPSWMSQDLNTKIFSNGDSLKFIDSKKIDEKNPFTYYSKPAYTIKKINGRDCFFYNFNAIQDKRGLAPKGQILPSANDYINLRNKGTHFEIISIKSAKNNNIFLFDTIGYYFDYYEKFSDGSQFYWIKNKNIVDDAEAAKFFIADNNKYTVQIFSQSSSNSLPVRCIEDLSESIKTKTYDYTLLMPIETKKVISRINELFKFTNINFNVQIDFNKEGQNTSKIIDYQPNSLNTQINLLNTFLSKIEKPLYQGQNLMAKTTLKIKLETEKIDVWSEKFEYSFNNDAQKFNTLNSTLTQLLYQAQSKLFSPKVEAYNRKLIINDSIYNSNEKNYLKGIKSRGVLFSAYSIIPGLGILKVDPIRKLKDGVKMMHFPIPLGIVSLSSFIYSSILYNDYRNSSDFSSSKFKQANTYHKVFLTTVTAYTILGLIDFTMTFRIGIKNNKLTRAINNEIKNNYNEGLLLN